ncbi:MFS transporter [Paenibacillus sp. TRM 82003]|nr:MFS transporter [Paenibacillus sp. TRM 82003]
MKAKGTTGRRRWSPFVLQLLLIMFLIEFVKGALLVSMLPIYFHSVLGLSAFTLGWAFSLQYVGDNALRGPVGWAIDTWGYRVTISAGLALTLAATATLAFLQTAPWMIAGCFLLGAGTSPLWPCVVAGATGASGEDGSGTALGAVYAAFFAGTGAGPTVINLFVGGADMRLPFRIVLGMTAAALVAGVLLPRRDVRGGGKWKSKPEAGPRRSIWKLLHDVPAGKLLYPAMFLQTFALGVLTPIITLYAREDLKLSPGEFSLLLLAGGAATLLLLLPVGRLTDRYGTRVFLHAGIPVAAGATAAFAFTDGRTQLYLVVIAVGIGYALVIPAWNALIAKAIPKERRGSVWGAFLTIEGAGFVAGPIVSGWLWDSIGHRAPFLASAAVLSVFFVLHLFISFRKSDVLR